MTITETIDLVKEFKALNGSTNVIRWALRLDGFSEKQIGTILLWSK